MRHIGSVRIFKLQKLSIYPWLCNHQVKVDLQAHVRKIIRVGTYRLVYWAVHDYLLGECRERWYGNNN